VSFLATMEALDLKRKMPYNKWITRNTQEFGVDRSLAACLGKTQEELNALWPSAGAGSNRVPWLKLARTHNAGKICWVAKVLTPEELKATGAPEFTETVRDQHPDCYQKLPTKRKREGISLTSSRINVPKLSDHATQAVRKRTKKTRGSVVLPSYIIPTPLHEGPVPSLGFSSLTEEANDAKRMEEEYVKEHLAIQRMVNIQNATANYRQILLANNASPSIIAQSLEQIGLLTGETLLRRLKSLIESETEDFYREVLIPWQRKREARTNPPTMGLAAYKGPNGQLDFPTESEYWDKMGEYAPTCRDLFTQLSKGKHKDPKSVVVFSFDSMLKNKHANASGNTTAYFPLVYRNSKKR